MFDWQKETRDGMLLMVSKNREYIEKTNEIVRRIHQDYIERNSNLYNSKELLRINYFVDSVAYKSFLVRIAVEQLQSVKFGRIEESLWPAIENSLNSLTCSDDEQVLVSFALESFLFEVRSFLDIYMILICLLLKTGFTNGYMSKATFENELKKSGPPFSLKAKWVKDYFSSEVFGIENNNEAEIFRKDWGELVRSLRDKIAHRDVIRKSFDSKEVFINNIRLEWPTLQKLTYHSFAETVGNGVHALFHKVLCHIYDLKWDDYLIHDKNPNQLNPNSTPH